MTIRRTGRWMLIFGVGFFMSCRTRSRRMDVGGSAEMPPPETSAACLRLAPAAAPAPLSAPRAAPRIVTRANESAVIWSWDEPVPPGQFLHLRLGPPDMPPQGVPSMRCQQTALERGVSLAHVVNLDCAAPSCSSQLIFGEGGAVLRPGNGPLDVQVRRCVPLSTVPSAEWARAYVVEHEEQCLACSATPTESYFAVAGDAETEAEGVGPAILLQEAVGLCGQLYEQLSGKLAADSDLSQISSLKRFAKLSKLSFQAECAGWAPHYLAALGVVEAEGSKRLGLAGAAATGSSCATLLPNSGDALESQLSAWQVVVTPEGSAARPGSTTTQVTGSQQQPDSQDLSVGISSGGISSGGISSRGSSSGGISSGGISSDGSSSDGSLTVITASGLNETSDPPRGAAAAASENTPYCLDATPKCCNDRASWYMRMSELYPQYRIYQVNVRWQAYPSGGGACLVTDEHLPGPGPEDANLGLVGAPSSGGGLAFALLAAGNFAGWESGVAGASERNAAIVGAMAQLESELLDAGLRLKLTAMLERAPLSQLAREIEHRVAARYSVTQRKP